MATSRRLVERLGSSLASLGVALALISFDGRASWRVPGTLIAAVGALIWYVGYRQYQRRLRSS